MQIVRLVSCGDLEDHPNLFSSATESSIVSILPSFFRAPCQLTVKLRYLTGHLRDVHHLNKTAAKRIASALRNEQGTIDGRSMGLFGRDENTLKAKKKKVKFISIS
jgi:hypothetical protein